MTPRLTRTMRLVGVAVVISLAMAQQSAAFSADFEVEILTRSAAEVGGVNQVEAASVLFSHRLLPGAPTHAFVELSGRLRDIEVHRFELEWAESGTEYRGDSVSTGQPTETTSRPPDGTVHLQSFGHEAALVLVADHLRAVSGGSPWKVITVAKDPTVGLQNVYQTYGAKPGPNETGGWRQDGTYVSTEAADFAGTASGKVRLYWFEGTMTLRSGSNVLTFESRVWDDPAIGGAYIRHSVWHELWATDADLDIASAKTSAISSTLFAKHLRLASVDSVTFDSASVVSGSLPPTAAVVGPSLWMEGDMELTLDVPDADTGQADHYRVQAQGLVQGYAVGGIPQIAAPAAVGAISVLALLATALFWARDLLAEAGARLWLGLHSRLRQDQVLDNGVRDTIFHLIQASPGIAFLALRDAVRTMGRPGGIGTGTLLHHLDQLQRFGLLASRRVGRFRRYYTEGQDGHGRNAARLALLHTPTAHDVARAILARPGLSKREVYSILRQGQEISLPGVVYHLKRLEGEGLLVSRMVGRRRCYEATDLLRFGFHPTA